MGIKRRNARHWVIGIDEAGRGPLAGPVVVAGAKIESGIMDHELWKGIKDSKKLSARRRDEWYQLLTTYPKIEWAVARISPKIIDRINIYHAAQLGAWRVYKKLSSDAAHSALLDGSLYLPSCVQSETIIRGDEKVPIISAASIIAKVTRDRIMLRLHKKYPQYRFDLHKGYGTKLHREKMKQFGRCEIHRRSFGKDILV